MGCSCIFCMGAQLSSPPPPHLLATVVPCCVLPLHFVLCFPSPFLFLFLFLTSTLQAKRHVAGGSLLGQQAMGACDAARGRACSMLQHALCHIQHNHVHLLRHVRQIQLKSVSGWGAEHRARDRKRERQRENRRSEEEQRREGDRIAKNFLPVARLCKCCVRSAHKSTRPSPSYRGMPQLP